MKKKYIISIEHPAWIHQFKYIIKSLQNEGNEVIILAINKDGTFNLLDSFGLKYIKVGETTGTGIIEKGWLFIKLCFVYNHYAFKYKPDLLFGRASPMMAVTAFLRRKKHIIYEDTEISRFSLMFCKMFSSLILTSTSFMTDLGKKHRKIDCYKELFYLHPQYFQPNADILTKCGFNINEKYVVIRFISWNASHDYSHKGLNDEQQINFVNEIKKHFKVYISSEKPLCKELQSFELKTPYSLIHHVLSFAQLYIGEGATMASEAAVLGTYALYINGLISGSTKELDEKYGLMCCFNKEDRYDSALNKMKEIAVITNFKNQIKEKRDLMLKGKTNINEYFIELINSNNLFQKIENM